MDDHLRVNDVLGVLDIPRKVRAAPLLSDGALVTGLSESIRAAIVGVVTGEIVPDTPAIPQDLADAVAWWNFRSASSPGLDASGNGNDLTVVGGPLVLGEGPGFVPNTGLVLNRATPQGFTRNIAPGDDLDIFDGRPYTIVTWARLDEGSAPRVLLCYRDGVGNDLARLQLTDDLAAPYASKYQITGVGGVCEVTYGAPISQELEYRMYLVSYDPATWAHRLEVWRGQSMADFPPGTLMSNIYGVAELPNTNAISGGAAVASFNVGLTATPANSWGGNVATTAFFRRLLSDSEKATIYNDAKGRTYPGA